MNKIQRKRKQYKWDNCSIEQLEYSFTRLDDIFFYDKKRNEKKNYRKYLKLSVLDTLIDKREKES